MNEMSSESISSSEKANELRQIARELRRIGVSRGMPVISASQLNRTGYGVVAGLNSIADSMGITFVADLIILIRKDEEMEESNLLEGRIIKTRYGRNHKVFNLAVNYNILEITFLHLF